MPLLTADLPGRNADGDLGSLDAGELGSEQIDPARDVVPDVPRLVK